MNTQKTLLAILIEELPKRGGWPSLAKKIHQDHDGAVWGWVTEDEPRLIFTLDQVATNASPHGKDETYENMVTRDQYEAALAEKEHPLPWELPWDDKKPDADGWIDWAGGECPVASGAMVDVKQRDNWFSECCSPDDWRWKHDGSCFDIIAYRLHQPQDANSRENDDRLEADLNDCIGQAPHQIWDGEEKPHIGAEVEWNEGRRWFPGTVTAITDEWIIIKDLRGNEGAYLLDVVKLRPATFERDELATALEQSADKNRGFVDVFKLVADDLMAAGYRKQ